MVSFLIPAYNCASTLAEAVESILQQGIEGEIVVLDDGSTDETPDVIRSLPVRHESNGRNLGLGPSRNRLMELASFDVVYWLDSDNLMAPDTAGRVLAPILGGEADAASPERISYFANSPEVVTHEWWMANRDGWNTAREMVASTHVPAAHANYAYRREMYEAVGPYYDQALMDWTWGFRAAFLGFPVRIVPGTRYFHRHGQTSPSLWERWEQRGLNDPAAVKVLQSHARFFDRRSQKRIAKLDGQRHVMERYINRGKLRLATGKFGTT